MSDDVQAVLDFWLGEVGPEGWYAGGQDLDGEIRDRFADLWGAAEAGGLEHWIGGTAPTLAYIVLTDQFPRNMWRGAAKSFATDAQARAAAFRAVEAGWDMAAPEPDRQFFYMPFMHSEAPEDLVRCIALFEERMPETGAANMLHARAHLEVIRRFGRFPQRNAALGRETTADEQAFFDNGGYRKIVQSLKEDM